MDKNPENYIDKKKGMPDNKKLEIMLIEETAREKEKAKEIVQFFSIVFLFSMLEGMLKNKKKENDNNG